MSAHQALNGYVGDDAGINAGRTLLQEEANVFPRNRRCRDCGFAVLFLALVAALIGVAYMTTSGFTFSDIDKRKRDEVPFQAIAAGLAVATIVSLILSFVALVLIKHFTETIVWATLLFSPVLMILSGVTYLAVIPNKTQAMFVFALQVVPAGLTLAFILCCYRGLVKFTADILRPVSSVIGEHFTGVACVGLLGIVSVFVYTVIASLGIVGAYSRHAICDSTTTKCQDEQGMTYAVYFVECFILFWGATAFMNMCHVTYCGIVGQWYFDMEPSVCQSFRATIVSFGSICLGSLIVSLVKAVHAVVDLMRRQNARDTDVNPAVRLLIRLFLCLLECVISCVQEIVEFMSYFAYVQVALRGFSFMQSVSATYALCKFRNMRAIFGASLVGNVVFLASLGCGSVAGLAGAGTAYAMRPEVPHNQGASSIALITFILGMLLGLATAEMILYSLRSGFATVAVCWAEDRTKLEHKYHELHLDFERRTCVSMS